MEKTKRRNNLMNDNSINTAEKTDNNEALSDLIQSIQSKLNNELDTEKIQDATTQSNETVSDTSNSNFDLGSIIGMLGKMNNSKEDSGFNLGDLDPSLFRKIQKVVVNIGKKDPKKDLLRSLKPFLRKSRQDKIGEYITILTIIKAFEAFSDKGSDESE